METGSERAAELRPGRGPAKPEGWRVNKGGVGEEQSPWGQILGAVAAAEQCGGQQEGAGRWRAIQMNWRDSLHSSLRTSAGCDHEDSSWKLHARRKGEEMGGRTLGGH